MAITVVTRWRAKSAQQAIDAAKKSKAFWLKNGAQDFRISQIHTGNSVGEWIVATIFKDMEAYGKATAVSSPILQKIVADLIKGGAVMMEREILIGFDI